jgi:hypothetical protein
VAAVAAAAVAVGVDFDPSSGLEFERHLAEMHSAVLPSTVPVLFEAVDRYHDHDHDHEVLAVGLAISFSCGCLCRGHYWRGYGCHQVASSYGRITYAVV